MLNMLDAGHASFRRRRAGASGDDGLEREAARAAVIARWKRGRVERVEERVIQVPHGDRSAAR
jgi:valyl-tRNA synthetase